jgi:micrococcal nuclease
MTVRPRTSWISHALWWVALGLMAAALSGCLPGGAVGATGADGASDVASSDGRAAAAPDVVEPSSAPIRPTGVPVGAQPARVARHVDGDTLWVEPLAGDHDAALPLPAGAASRIRVLLIDTPETVHPTRGVECGGVEASAATAALLPQGALIWVLGDVSDRDRYDRFLRYLYTADGTDLGAHLLELGLASVAHYPPDELHLARYRQIEADARSRGAGIWGALCPLP